MIGGVKKPWSFRYPRRTSLPPDPALEPVAVGSAVEDQ